MEYAFRNTLVRFLVVFTMLAALCVLPASAQVSSGSISGTVVDPSGAAMADAQVKATSAATAQTFTATSGSTGSFRLLQLPTGAYSVEVTKSGFRKSLLTGLIVSSAVDTGIGAVKMEVGVATETVEVSGATPLVQTTEAQVSATFSSAYLNNIPGIQENQGLDNLAILLPGVSASRDLSFSNTNGVGFTVNGLRGRNNDQQVDGQANNDNSVAGPGLFVGDSEFVDQYQVVTNNFGPEYGRNSGSVVNIMTKSGSNTWHGSVYGTEGNSVLNSLSNLQGATGPAGLALTKVPHFNDAFVGATIGGPWVKNKVFFFGGYDTEANESSTIYASQGAVPTPAGVAAMSGCYTDPTSQQAIAALTQFGAYGIGGGNPTPVSPGIVQFDGISPNTGLPYAGFVPNNVVDGTCDVEMGAVQRGLSNSNHQYDWVTRVDVTGTNDTVYGRYLWQKLSFFNTDAFGTAGVGYPSNVPSTGQQMAISWTHKISDRMVNELRINYSRLRVEFGGNTIGNTIPRTGQIGDAVSNILILDSSQQGFGPATNAPQGRIVNTYQLQDNWSYVRGNHQLKAGINYTYQRSPNTFLPNLNGRFIFLDYNNFAGNDPLIDQVTLGNSVLDFREHDSFFYFGDDWKIRNDLTLNLGLTFSYYGQPANLFHDNTVKQQSGSNPFWDPSLPTNITTFPSIPAPKNSWGPSIGFAYSPQWGGFLFGGKTTFRGGYRLSYDPPFYNIYLNIASAAPQVLAQSIGAGPALPAVPTGANTRALLAPFLTLGVGDPRNATETNVTPDFGPDRVHGWSFGVQRELGDHAAFEARYVGNHGQNLFQSINANPYIQGLADGIADGVFNADVLPSGLTPCAVGDISSATGRVHCDEGRVRSRTNTAYSDYNGLQSEFRANNLFKQLTMKTNYTFSKTTDNASEIFGTFGGGGSYAFSQNPLNFTTGEHGLSGLDFQHTWTVSFFEEIPFFRSQKGIVGHVLGGWSMAGAYILQSGQPYTAEQVFFGSALSPYNSYDSAFDAAFNSGLETARPFLGNPSAPDNSVGMYAIDACAFFGDPVSCGAAPDDLVDFTALNSTGNTTVVNSSQVHFIANTFEAQTIFGTPFGNVGRNSLRSAKTNSANFQVTKMTKWGERVKITWHMSMTNAFNHGNLGYVGPGSLFATGIDPFIEDAGLKGLGTGFADPSVFDGGHRSIRFGIKVSF